jgi:hypothetical protein
MPRYQVDAFALKGFSGDPATGCLPEAWIEDATMQAIATENNPVGERRTIPSTSSATLKGASIAATSCSARSLRLSLTGGAIVRVSHG